MLNIIAPLSIWVAVLSHGPIVRGALPEAAAPAQHHSGHLPDLPHRRHRLWKVTALITELIVPSNSKPLCLDMPNLYAHCQSLWNVLTGLRNKLEWYLWCSSGTFQWESVPLQLREPRLCKKKGTRGGRGVIFKPKIYVADFGNFKHGFLSMKLMQKSNFRVQGMLFQQLYWEKSKQNTLWRRL